VSSKRPFTRPRRLTPFGVLRSEVNVPGLLLRLHPELFTPARSVTGSLPRSFQCGEDLRRKPVAGSVFKNFGSNRLLPLPIGVFRPLRLVALGRLSTQKVYLGEQPDFPSLPFGADFHRSPMDHRSGSATVRQACFLQNLLEPSV
jgi:hypothetical protein